jgi:hypothetical protein
MEGRQLQFVAQVGNLLYRRLAVGMGSEIAGGGGLSIRDTADYQSALPCLRPCRAGIFVVSH